MRATYIRALEAAVSILSDAVDLSTVSPDDLSELKGMLNRCIRKDQWDWFSVYDLLDRPEQEFLRKLAQQMAEMTRALRGGNKRSAERAKSSGDPPVLRLAQRATTRLRASVPQLPTARRAPP